jgi:hypothetical protein
VDFAQLEEQIPADVRDLFKILAETTAKYEQLMRVYMIGYYRSQADLAQGRRHEE